jgi:hypothetical protein
MKSSPIALLPAVVLAAPIVGAGPTPGVTLIFGWMNDNCKGFWHARLQGSVVFSGDPLIGDLT